MPSATSPAPMTNAASYDPALRCKTPLADKLATRIRADGPISVAQYVDACLSDPDHGYYIHNNPIGASADFVTAPEISQIFGELIGIWCALAWQQFGQPSQINLIELGPGRATLISDALRAMAKVPGLSDALHVHMVESNSSLRKLQSEKLATHGVPFSQSATMADLQTIASQMHGPAIIIANEFLDALGVQQLIARSGRWHDRCVGIARGTKSAQNGSLEFAVGAGVDGLPPHYPSAADQPEGAIFERNPALVDALAPLLAELCRSQPTVALFIDYGHEVSSVGETLQAVRQHAYEHPLTSPGEADLTAQVDFADVAQSLSQAGLQVTRPLTQAEFLGRLGLVERTSHLMSANPERAALIESGSLRLMAPNGMGTRFKAIAATGQDLPLPPIFTEFAT